MGLAHMFLLPVLGSSFVHFPIKTFFEHINTGQDVAKAVNVNRGLWQRGDQKKAEEQLHIMMSALLFKMMMNDVKVLKKYQLRGVQEPISRLNMFMVRAIYIGESFESTNIKKMVMMQMNTLVFFLFCFRAVSYTHLTLPTRDLV